MRHWKPNDKIFIHGFSPDPFRADKPLLAHSGGLCLYYRENNKLFFIVSYRHPNQSIEETESYFSSLNDIIEKVANEKPKAIVFFWVNDADTTECPILGEVSISNNLEQLLNEPTHIRDDGTQTCIDLIYTNQKYAFISVEVLPHSVSQSKHLILHGEVNFNVSCPPPYKGKTWEYNRAVLIEKISFETKI